MAGEINPETIPESNFSEDVESFPDITGLDIAHFLISSHSGYTQEELRCYKSLEAYNQYVSGWVRQIKSYTFTDSEREICIIKSKVLHSQSLSKQPLMPTIVISNGNIKKGHCQCMAGQGETCTHIAATLYAVEHAVRLRGKKTVTQQLAYWRQINKNIVPFSKVSEMDFSSAKSKRRKLEEVPSSQSVTKLPHTKGLPTELEKKQFLLSLSNLKEKPVILSVTAPYNQKFVPLETELKLPDALTLLYDINLKGLKLRDILPVCEYINIQVSEEEAANVEMATRKQQTCHLWFKMRAGRITASNMKAVVTAKVETPPVALIKRIVYPEAAHFSSVATIHGLSKEKCALQKYLEVQSTKSNHLNLKIREAGFVINPNFPHLGASPDSYVSCDCCGTGVVEVKCTYKHKNKVIADIKDNGFCLQMHHQEYKLKRSHPYFYQVQTQLHICDVNYADFVVYTDKDVHIERVTRDPDLWETCLEKSSVFFKNMILPELVAHCYTL